ncbi:hypothetical protein OSH11_23185 [Kaistia dalseonensis]|uniref:Uncharacterized protein n=1 Tax=Kaistia dalseonensis TaxID=410840 RepID=A0ABU0HEI3_9HYPH|nr:hypothetical protein [Kaistia dalseonensis]MCX5497621.1 hypothetical protein [Kaistia dalseonensis]MDQ0440263.1 hypothetical protein [Kaistia dalseonensis]
MAVILAFSTAGRRRARPVRSGERRGEIVFFSGVRIDRSPTRTDPPSPKQTRAPKPGRSF